jgi:hypothetical protein
MRERTSEEEEILTKIQQRERSERAQSSESFLSERD